MAPRLLLQMAAALGRHSGRPTRASSKLPFTTTGGLCCLPTRLYVEDYARSVARNSCGVSGSRSVTGFHVGYRTMTVLGAMRATLPFTSTALMANWWAPRLTFLVLH